MVAYTEKRTKLERVLRLTQNRATGTPGELAQRLGTSERTARRLIESLKEDGYNIRYCRRNCTYFLIPSPPPPHKYVVKHIIYYFTARI